MIVWLRNNDEPMTVVLDKWAKTSAYRYKTLLESDQELEYFISYPAMRGVNACQLVSINYNR